MADLLVRLSVVYIYISDGQREGEPTSRASSYSQTSASIEMQPADRASMGVKLSAYNHFPVYMYISKSIPDYQRTGIEGQVSPVVTVKVISR